MSVVGTIHSHTCERRPTPPPPPPPTHLQPAYTPVYHSHRLHHHTYNVTGRAGKVFSMGRGGGGGGGSAPYSKTGWQGFCSTVARSLARGTVPHGEEFCGRFATPGLTTDRTDGPTSPMRMQSCCNGYPPPHAPTPAVAGSGPSPCQGKIRQLTDQRRWHRQRAGNVRAVILRGVHAEVCGCAGGLRDASASVQPS